MKKRMNTPKFIINIICCIGRVKVEPFWYWPRLQNRRFPDPYPAPYLQLFSIFSLPTKIGSATLIALLNFEVDIL